MRVLEEFLKPTQKALFKMICKMFKNKVRKHEEDFILVKGEVPILLVAHLDTVHKEPVRDICKSKGGNILMSPQGIGGDDRCGVYALVNAYEMAPKKPWLLFTTDEEIGGLGAISFCKAHKARKLPKDIDTLKLIVEIDRRGSNDAVYYDCANTEFENYITSKGFKTSYGSFSDISYIAPELGIAAVNLSSGYYDAHCLHEHINRQELNAVLDKVVEIISDTAKTDFPTYRYVEKIHEFKSTYRTPTFWLKGTYKETSLFTDEPKRRKIPSEYEQIYNELLEIYTVDELEHYRELYNDEVLYQIYIDEFGPFYADEK